MKSEMQEILSAQASAIKKMTDLSILLQGVEYYLSTLEGHDEFFKMLLDEVVGILWVGTPDFEGALGNEEQEVDLHNEKVRMVIRKMDKIVFLQKYQEQIRRVSAYFTDIMQYDPAPNSFPKTIGERTVAEGLKANLQQEFYLNSNYRCRDIYIPIDSDDLIRSVVVGWQQIQHPGLYGGDILPYLQLTLELARPVASMGHSYDTFLNTLNEKHYVLQQQNDSNDLVSSTTKQNFDELIAIIKPK